MTTSTQTQHRRGTGAQCDAITPAAGELIYDTTNNRWRAGDGATLGGIIVPTAKDLQIGSFTYVAQTGAANAWTATLAPVSPSPVAGSRVTIKCVTANTTAFTLNVDAHGAVSVKKKSGGALVDPVSGDTFVGGIYEFRHDGTYWELINELNTGSGTISVSQGNLNTSTGAVSAVVTGVSGPGFSDLQLLGTLPGGEYAFGFEGKEGTLGTGSNVYYSMGHASTTYIRKVYGVIVGTGSRTIFAQERYVNASPPVNMGDGDCHGFIFARLDKDGKVLNTYVADVPPWLYNGPTKVRADHICPVTRKKYRRVARDRSLEEIMGGAQLEYYHEEITHKIKNADMHLIPHPFQGAVGPDETVVLLDPFHDRLLDLIAHQNAGGGIDITDALHKGTLYADNEVLNRKGPPGVPIVPLRFKYTR